jgi:hypothetical protein
MSRSLPGVCCLFLLLPAAAYPRPPALRTGDVVLQTSRSAQSKAIQQATRSPYSHVGVVEVAPDGVFVVEAISPVSRTRWDKWRRRGEGGRYTVLRQRSADAAALERVVAAAKGYLGRPYDFEFRWGDEALYCSELVYRAFEQGVGAPVGRLQPLSSLSLSGLGPALAARYAGKVPLDLRLVTPASIAADPGLEQVESTY